MDWLGKKVAFYTLGCKLNFSETSSISRDLVKYGFVKVDFEEIADVYIINTCSVTQQAEKKCRYIINKAIKKAPNAKIIVTGCYAQLKSSELANIEGVDYVLGTDEKFNIYDFLINSSPNKHQNIHTHNFKQMDEYHPAYSIDERTRSYLKIQDGCDYFCAYCTIPYARGRSRNYPIANIVQSAQEIAENGVKEIIITGVNIGDFGKSTNETLFQLLQAFETSVNIERIRISSIEPNLLTTDILKLIQQSKKILPHFHIPLQGGTDSLLKNMNRKYNTSVFLNKVNEVKMLMPESSIGIDIVVGFPGETETDFEETISFLKNLNINYLHVFPFSERPGTRAAEMSDKVDFQTKEKRCKIISEISEQKKTLFYQQNINKTYNVLFESYSKGVNTGFTENYIKVELVSPDNLKGTIRRIKLVAISEKNNMIALLQ